MRVVGSKGTVKAVEVTTVQSRAKALGHAIHPVLIVFPLGLLSTAVIFDVLYLVTGRSGFTVAAAYAIAAGVVGGLVAAVFGLIDWLAIPPATRAKRIGLWHGGGNVIVVVLFAGSWLLRAGADGWEPTGPALMLSFLGVALASLTGWLGGELVERLGVGVDDGAHLDAPSSLSHRRVNRRKAAKGTDSRMRHTPEATASTRLRRDDAETLG
jgi:uncharacterized membrane protein